MKTFRISLLIFLVFFTIQGLRLTRLHIIPAKITGSGVSGHSRTPETGSTLPALPVIDGVKKDTLISPPRRVVAWHYESHPGSRRDGMGISPVTAWAFGYRMNWETVTVENLRWIPGMGRGMAQRLIRIRDTFPITRFRDLKAFPHVGRKTIQRLKRYCFIPHAA